MGGLGDRVATGAVVLAVNAGFQVLGTSYVTPDGQRHEGLGLLDVRSSRAATPHVGPATPTPRVLAADSS